MHSRSREAECEGVALQAGSTLGWRRVATVVLVGFLGAQLMRA